MKRAIVTGCSRGIGRAVAEMLLTEGWSVWGVSRTDPGIERDYFWWVEADVARTERRELRYILGGRPFDALVHCAAVRGEYGPLADGNADDWEQTVATNLLGTYRIVRAALPLLERSEDGRILLFSGGGAFDPSPNYSAYAVSKAGVVSLMETLAAELQQAGSTVTVNCVAPGFVATGIHAGTPEAGRPEREGALGDVVACVRHLLSPATQGLSGRTVAAQYDDWRSLSSWTVPALMETDAGTRWRHPIQQCQRLLRRAASMRS